MAYNPGVRAAAARMVPAFVAAATSTINFSSEHDGQRLVEETRNKHRLLPMTYCDAAPAERKEELAHASSYRKPDELQEGFQPKEEGFYADMFPRRQLWQPKLEYPLWCVEESKDVDTVISLHD